MNSTLSAHYRRYIDSINASRVDRSDFGMDPAPKRNIDLREFVHDHATYNGRFMSRESYEGLISPANSVFEIEMLVVQEDAGTVASRLVITWEERNAGALKEVKIIEHVFYRFEEGRIKEVWSLLEKQ